MAYLDCTNCTKKPQQPGQYDKWRYTLYTTVIFLLVVNPYTYKLTNKLFSKLLGPIANASGCPTMVGIILHAVVFTLLLRLLMDFDI